MFLQFYSKEYMGDFLYHPDRRILRLLSEFEIG